MKKPKFKKYKFLYRDKDKNVITENTYEFLNIKDARDYARVLFGESMLNELTSIKVVLE